MSKSPHQIPLGPSAYAIKAWLRPLTFRLGLLGVVLLLACSTLSVHAETVTMPLRQIGIGQLYKAAWAPDEQAFLTGAPRGGVYLWNATTGEKIRGFSGHSGNVVAVAFSPDGKRIMSGGQDKTIRLWETATGKLTRTISKHTGSVNSVAFSPDGQKILSGSGDNTARLWDVATGNQLTTLTGHTDVIAAVAFSPDGKKALTTSWDQTARLWDTVTGKSLFTFTGHTGKVLSAAFAPDGKQVLTGGVDNTVRLWDAEKGTLGRVITFSTAPRAGFAYSVAFSRDGKTVYAGVLEYVLVGSGAGLWLPDFFVKSWNTATGVAGPTCTGHVSSINTLNLSVDGKILRTGSQDGTARSWNATTGALLTTLKPHNYSISTASFSPDGKRILTGEDDGMAYVWNVRDGSQRLAIKALHSPTLFQGIRAAFSPSGARLLTCTRDGIVRIWDANTGAQITTITTHVDGLVSAVFKGSDGQVLIGGQTSAELWDLGTGKILRTFGTSSAAQVAISQNGMRIATIAQAMNTCDISLWNSQTGAMLYTRTVNSYSLIHSFEFLPDGSRFLTSSTDGATTLWETATGTVLKTFSKPLDRQFTYCAAISPDGAYALIGGQSQPWTLLGIVISPGTAWLLNTNTGAALRSYFGDQWDVFTTAFSPDSQLFLTAGRDGATLLWKADPSRNAVTKWQNFE